MSSPEASAGLLSGQPPPRPPRHEGATIVMSEASAALPTARPSPHAMLQRSAAALPSAANAGTPTDIYGTSHTLAAPLDTEAVRCALEAILRLHEAIRDMHINIALHACNAFDDPVVPRGTRAARVNRLDDVKIRNLTALARRPGSNLEDLVRLVRGETVADPRPNKAFRPDDLRRLLKGYPHADFMVQMASTGLEPSWYPGAQPSNERRKDHQSAYRFLNAVVRSIRAGQDENQYLVVDSSLLEQWDQVQVSPFGAVEKKGVDPRDEVRLIHDLSDPKGGSVNDATDRSTLPTIVYIPVAAVTRRVETLYAEQPDLDIEIMKGDVKGAFRHLRGASRHVGWMGALLQQLGVLVIDLSAPFGWSASPTFYGAVGGSISWVLSRKSPATIIPGDPDDKYFFAYEWVDDHILVEHNVGNRLAPAASALRLSMMAVLGPRALNEKKFSAWSTKLEVLGFEFDTLKRTVSMPTDKIDKAKRRVVDLLGAARASKTKQLKLMGSLRHVSTCCRALRPFYQRVHALASSASVHGSVTLTASVREDLSWCMAILERGQLQNLPTAMFCDVPAADVHLYMDASNEGLAVLDPARRRYIQVKFDEVERALIATATGTNAFTINVREQLSVAFAVAVWGPTWGSWFRPRVGQIWCWIDNTTAVSSTNKLASTNALAQELNRFIGYAEATQHFRARCIHLPGAVNVMADAASRAWAPPHADMWRVYAQNWRQDHVPLALRKIYACSSVNSNSTGWRPALGSSTSLRGGSGAPGAANRAGDSGCLQTGRVTRSSSRSSPFTAGAQQAGATAPPPYCPRSATSHGIIVSTEDMRWDSTQATSWPCEGCSGCQHRPEARHPPPSASSEPYEPRATSSPPMTASYGGLRSWASSIFLEAQSICKSAAPYPSSSSQ